MNALRDTNIAERHRELAAVAATLARLRAQYDMLMNAFKFDEARALQSRIETTERQRRELAAGLPPAPPEAEPTPYRVVTRRGRRGSAAL